MLDYSNFLPLFQESKPQAPCSMKIPTSPSVVFNIFIRNSWLRYWRKNNWFLS
ncbi:MAG: hypothetical protein ACJAX1_001367, partial [Neolewinella sp.]